MSDLKPPLPSNWEEGGGPGAWGKGGDAPLFEKSYSRNSFVHFLLQRKIKFFDKNKLLLAKFTFVHQRKQSITQTFPPPLKLEILF